MIFYCLFILRIFSISTSLEAARFNDRHECGGGGGGGQKQYEL